MPDTNLPLAGVKVVELATMVAAPVCCRFLGDLGADVIKVETKRGDTLRYVATNEGRPFGDTEDTTYTQENTNKRAVILNLKTEAGMEAFHKLLADADVFVTNNRPAALARLGLDWDTLKQKYPKLVMGLVLGYGEKGPEKDLPGYDFTTYFARSGIMGTMYDVDSMPMLPSAGFGDSQVAMNLAAGIIAALYRAEKTGKGDKVTASLLHAGIFVNAINITASQYGDPNMQYPVARNTIPNQLQLEHLTKDGRWLMICIPPYDLLYNKFMEALGRPDLVNDERFYPQSNAVDHLPELYEIIKDEIASKTIDEWLEIFAEADIPASKCYTWDEILDDEQSWANDYLAEVEFPSGNKRTLIRTPVAFEDTPLPPYERAPWLGEHTKEVLAEIGYTEDEIAKMMETDAASDVQRIG